MIQAYSHQGSCVVISITWKDKRSNFYNFVDWCHCSLKGFYRADANATLFAVHWEVLWVSAFWLIWLGIITHCGFKMVMAHTKDNIVWLNASHKNLSKKFIRRHNIKINQNNNSLTTQQKKKKMNKNNKIIIIRKHTQLHLTMHMVSRVCNFLSKFYLKLTISKS